MGRSIDSIHWVSLLLLGLFVVVGLTALAGRNQPATPPPSPLAQIASPTATHTRPPTATPTVTATSRPVIPASLTPRPTITHPPTLAITPTETASPLPTATTPPLPTPNGVYSQTVRVPILMYHYVSIPPADADEVRLDLTVIPSNFQAQMVYLAAHDFTPIDFYDLSLAIVGKKSLPAKPIILTFDDGYLDMYENVFPVLRQHDFEATFFLITEFIDNQNPLYMNWQMVEELAAAGMRMEPHTKTHIDLRDQDEATLIWQILGSQQTVAAHIGYLPRFFAYPAGRYDDNTIATLTQLDFWGAVTTEFGKWHGFDDRYTWTRIRVHGNTTLADFADLVEPGE